MKRSYNLSGSLHFYVLTTLMCHVIGTKRQRFQNVPGMFLCLLGIQYCSDYKYLGLVLNEFLDYNVTAKSVALSANRALGLVIAKCKILGGVSYGVFTKLYDSMVSSIIEYGAGIWGTKNYSCINAIQNRACRFFLGVGKYTPNNAILGDIGWEPIFHRQWKAVTNLWCRLNNMNTDRLNRKVFVWADQISTSNKQVKNWNYYIKKHFCELNFNHFCNIAEFIDTSFVVNSVLSKMFLSHVNKWRESLNADISRSGRGGNKLRTYRLFKDSYNTENYCKIPLPFSHRSAFAKFRCGVAPLRIETGRYENVSVNERVCSVCTNEVEDEAHVILRCPLYNNFRDELFNVAVTFKDNFLSLTDSQKLVFLFSNFNMIRICAKTCDLILKERRNFIYCK